MSCGHSSSSACSVGRRRAGYDLAAAAATLQRQEGKTHSLMFLPRTLDQQFAMTSHYVERLRAHVCRRCSMNNMREVKLCHPYTGRPICLLWLVSGPPVPDWCMCACAACCSGYVGAALPRDISHTCPINLHRWCTPASASHHCPSILRWAMGYGPSSASKCLAVSFKSEQQYTLLSYPAADT